MATKFVPVTDYDTIYELWSVGLLYRTHGYCGTPRGHLSKEWYLRNWTLHGLPGGPYGYMSEV